MISATTIKALAVFSGNPRSGWLDACVRQGRANLQVSGVSFRAWLAYSLSKESSGYYSASDRIDLTDTTSNRICRDWIFGTPLAKASGWKRLFRRAWPDDDPDAISLFGMEKKIPPDVTQALPLQESALKGELKFHHAFFASSQDQVAVITPRDQESGKVKGAIIKYEVVPPGETTVLTIDYFPCSHDPGRAARVLSHLLRAAVKAQEDAIGGKTSSNFGRLILKRVTIQIGKDLPANVTQNQKILSEVAFAIGPEVQP